MSSEKRLNHPNEVVKTGQTVKAVVLNIDRDNERFDTREHPTADNRPILTVEFSPPSVAVERATWSGIKGRRTP